MADSSISVTEGSGKSVDTRTNAGGDHRQVVVLGDPSVTDNVVNVVTADPGPTSSTPGIVFRLAGSAQVQIAGATGTIGAYITGTAGTIHTYLDPGTTLEGIQSSVAVHLVSTAGTIGVRVGQVDGSVAVYFSPASPTVLANNQHTASIFTVSGSTSGGTTSGVTLVAPSANYNFKVFAYSIQTTGIVSSAIRFTNGGGSETELWRPLITAAATSSSPVGANLAVSPPAYIFATGTSTTLALKNDSGSLVHYSVSYIKESA